MTIRELKKEKNNLEYNILKLIQDFEKKTDTHIYDIKLEHDNCNKPSFLYIDVRI